MWLSDQRFGRTILDVGQAPTYALYGFLAKFLHIDYAISERLIHLWPTVLVAPVSCFFYSRLFSKKIAATAIATLVYCCNTYFLQLLTGDITIASAYAIAPLVVYCFVRFFEQQTLKQAVIAALAAFIMTCYEPRIMYVAMLAVVIHYAISLYIKIRRSEDFKSLVFYIFKSSYPFIIFGLLNAYWLLGIAKLGGSVDGTILSRALFGNNFYSITNAFTISQPFWTGGKPESFVRHRIFLNQWILPVMAVLSLCFSKRTKLFWTSAILVCIGVLLSKQVSEPFTYFYPWLYQNAPGFNAFREASKFYLLVALGYAGLSALLVDTFSKKLNPRLFYTALSIVFILLAINTLPFITGKVETTTAKRSMPDAYAKWNAFIEKDTQYSRSLWVPTMSRWIDNTSLHPTVSAVNVAQIEWANFSGANKLPANGQNPTPQQNQIINSLTKSFSQSLLHDSSIKYVVVPIRDTANDDDFFKDYSDNRDFYIQSLQSIPYLKQVKGDFAGLKVFENNNYKDYFTASNSYTTLGNDDIDRSDFYEFLERIHLDTPAGETTKNYTLPASEVVNPIAQASSSDYKQGGLTVSIPGKNAAASAYIQKKTQSYGYNTKGNTLHFYSLNDASVSLNDIKQEQPSSTELKSLPLSTGNNYLIGYGQQLYPITKTENTRVTGPTDQAVNIFSQNTSSRNLVKDGNFSSGLWGNPSDCNSYDDKPVISARFTGKIDDNSPESEKSATLGASKHTSCITTNGFSVTAGNSYSLSYKYAIHVGQRAGYDIVFNDARKTVLSNDQVRSDGQTYYLNTFFTAPVGATSAHLRLKGYPDDRNRKYGQTSYTNVSVYPLRLESPIAAKIDSKPQPIVLPLNKPFQLTASSNNTNSNNEINNPSLESGLWQSRVGDCNRYDDNADLNMKLSSSASNGNKSLELLARRHTACTSPESMKVNEGKTYTLSFDYQSPNSDNASYLLSFDDENNTHYSERISVKDKNWGHFIKSFTAPYGAKNARLTVYAQADDNKNAYITNRYDNFSFKETPTIQSDYWVVYSSDSKLSTPRSVRLVSNNQTTKKVAVEQAGTGFYLNMSEAYDPGWQLFITNPLNGKITTINQNLVPHLKTDGYLNSWYINTDKICEEVSTACTNSANGKKSFELTVSFIPQKGLEKGLIISGATLATILLYLLATALNKIKPAKKKSTYKVVGTHKS